MSTFLNVQQSSDISGSVSVLHGTEFQSFRIGSAGLSRGRFAVVDAADAVVHAGALACGDRGRRPRISACHLDQQWLRAKARTRLTMIKD